MPAPPQLLNLPREIRDKILDYTTHASLETLSSDPGAYEKLSGFKSAVSQWNHERHAPRYCNFMRSDILPTLLVNRQLYEEIIDTLHRIPERHSYSVEAVVFNEDELRIKWLSVPVLTTRVEKVRTTFRIEGISKGKRCAFSEGCGGPPSMIWCLYNSLERFLKNGPVGHQDNTKELDRGMSIKTLELDVRTPDVPEDMLEPNFESMRYKDLCALRKNTGIDYVMHPKRFAGYLYSYIFQLLSMSRYTSSYGGILYERIGHIKILVDGVSCGEWDLAKLLAQLKFQDKFGKYPWEQSEERFWQWKKAAYKTRLEYGLPVLAESEVAGDVRSNWMMCQWDSWRIKY